MTRIPVESRDCVLELRRARHVQLTFDAHDHTVVEPIDGNSEVGHIPHESRV
jgi:hypothetical protein